VAVQTQGPPASSTDSRPPVAGRAAGSRRRSNRASRFERGARGVWVLVLGVALGYPLFELFRRSLFAADGSFTLEHYGRLVSNPNLIGATINSLWIGIGTVVGSLLIAMPLAYLVARTDLPGRGFFRTCTVLTFAAPSFIAALGWILLLGRNGLINTALMSVFGLEEPPFNIFTPWGIIFVLSMFLYPLIFLPVAAALNNIDPALEQAAASLGASRQRLLRTVTLPLVLPATLGGCVLVFVTGFVIFGPVAILGAPVGFRTIPMVLLELISFPPQIETAAVMSVPVLIIIGLALLLQRRLVGARRFAVIGGKPGARQAVPLGRAKPLALLFASSVFVVSLVLPFGILFITSFRRALGRPLGRDNLVLLDNYQRVFQAPEIAAAFRNSFVLAIGAVLLALLLALLASWLVQRTTARSNALIAPVMTSSLAFPGAVLGIGLIIAFARPPFGLGGSLTILLIGYTVSALPLAFLYVNAAMSQLGTDIEEASRSLGAGWMSTYRRITLPLLRPALAAVGLLTFVLMFRELEMSIFLYTGANPTTATVLYELAGESLFQLVGALATVILAVNVAVVLIAVRLLGAGTTSETA
jgi:iron(III) transport system permease protein